VCVREQNNVNGGKQQNEGAQSTGFYYIVVIVSHNTDPVRLRERGMLLATRPAEECRGKDHRDVCGMCVGCV